MKVSLYIQLLLFSISAWGQPDNNIEARQKASPTTAATALPTLPYEPSEVRSALDEWLSMFPPSPMVEVPSETLAISIPHSMMGKILTGVPGSVVFELIDESARASVAQEFREGNTPAWYTSLDEDVRSFFEAMAGAIETGDAVYTVTPTPTASADDEREDSGTSSSEDAAVPTGLGRGVVGGAIGLAGFVGVVLAL